MRNNLSIKKIFSSEFKKIFANTGWLVIDRILRMGIGLIVFGLLARHLGVDNFGVYSFASAFTGLFSPLVTMGISDLVVRSLAQEPEKRNEFLGTTFYLKLIGALLAFLLSLTSVYLFRQHDPLTIKLVAVFGSAWIFAPFTTIDLWYQSRLESKRTVVAQSIAFLLFSVLKILLININAPVTAFALAFTAEVMVGSVSLMISYQMLGYSPWKWRWNFAIAKDWLRQSWSFILSGFAIVAYMKIDQVMLGAMLNDNAV